MSGLSFNCFVKYLIREFDKINGSGKVKDKAKYSNANNLYETLK